MICQHCPNGQELSKKHDDQRYFLLSIPAQFSSSRPKFQYAIANFKALWCYRTASLTLLVNDGNEICHDLSKIDLVLLIDICSDLRQFRIKKVPHQLARVYFRDVNLKRTQTLLLNTHFTVTPLSLTLPGILVLQKFNWLIDQLIESQILTLFILTLFYFHSTGGSWGSPASGSSHTWPDQASTWSWHYSEWRQSLGQCTHRQQG